MIVNNNQCNCCSCTQECYSMTIYKIEDLFDCNKFNFYALITDLYIRYLDYNLFKSYIPQDKWQMIFEYISGSFCLWLNSLPIYFQANYVSFDLDALRCKIYKLFLSTFHGEIIKIINYLMSIDFTNYKDNTIRQNVATVNDEPNRTPIKDLSDMQLGNISLQNGGWESVISNQNLNTIFDTISNRPNVLNSALNMLGKMLKAILSPYTSIIRGISCTNRAKGVI